MSHGEKGQQYGFGFRARLGLGDSGLVISGSGDVGMEYWLQLQGAATQRSSAVYKVGAE